MSNQTHHRRVSSSSYYFVQHHAGTTQTVRDAGDEVEVIDEIPAGASAAIFAPKIINPALKNPSFAEAVPHPPQILSHHPISSSENKAPLSGLSAWFRSSWTKTPKIHHEFDGAKKVDPKVFLSNERTFLAWMHAGILLAAISIAISAGSEPGSAAELYGLLILPIGIAFIIYACLQYAKRSYMVLTRSPQSFEDRWGPLVLGSVFIVGLTAEFAVALARSG